jgi:carbonic anhydrase
MSRIMGGASRIIQGIQHFQERVFGDKKSLFRRLGEGQSPLALFITCCDSRIDPNLLTQTKPGELFIHRNIGNLVPPHGNFSSIDATLEYALKQLHLRDVIVCGHSKCGAMQGLLAPESLRDMPGVAAWLMHARAILPGVEQDGAALSPADKLNLTIERNVVLQREHLKTYPFVFEAVAAGQLRLHAWVYHIETGQVTAHAPGREHFVPLAEVAQQERLTGIPAGPVEHSSLGDSM